jgi:endonuclease YncB( thermonuclease family)
MILGSGKVGLQLILAISLASMASVVFSCICLGTPDEAYGTVTNIVDGGTFDLEVEKADPRIADRLERVRLADVDCPDMKTEDGPASRDFTYAVLQGRRVYLDIDDHSPTGRDSQGNLVCQVYLAGAYGQLLAAQNFNRLLVDSGHARLDNSTDNEFDPQYWWEDGSSGFSGGALENVSQDIREEAASQDRGVGRERPGRGGQEDVAVV